LDWPATGSPTGAAYGVVSGKSDTKIRNETDLIIDPSTGRLPVIILFRTAYTIAVAMTATEADRAATGQKKPR
jgi:hypothetical protein